MTLNEIEQALNDAGLDLRGAFRLRADDAAPPLADGGFARTMVLAGNAGPRMWRSFAAACAERALTLDAWSRNALTEVAAQFGVQAVFPFERPYRPFQRWAMRAEACHASPLGLLIHPDYGLWHGYRGALLFADEVELAARDARASPCAGCTGRPCLAGCPVGAFSPAGYDVSACVRHLAATPDPACVEVGCLARHACPAGGAYRYAPEQARFHMLAFLKEHGREGAG